MDWNDHASEWDGDPAVRTYADGAFERLGTLLERLDRPTAQLRVLDFGCGTGLLTERLAPRCKAVVALDPASKMIEVVQAKVDAHGWDNVRPLAATLEQAQASHPATFAEPFDLIVCSSVCAFVPDYPGTVQALASLLAPGGLFVQFDWELDESAEEPYGLSRAGIRSALERAGLSNIVVETAFERPMGEITMAPLLGAGTTTAP